MKLQLLPLGALTEKSGRLRPAENWCNNKQQERISDQTQTPGSRIHQVIIMFWISDCKENIYFVLLQGLLTLHTASAENGICEHQVQHMTDTNLQTSYVVIAHKSCFPCDPGWTLVPVTSHLQRPIKLITSTVSGSCKEKRLNSKLTGGSCLTRPHRSDQRSADLSRG